MVVFVLAVGPGAVRWHRHAITNESIGWIPRIPDFFSLAYVAKLVGLAFAFSVFNKIASSISNDLFYPVLGMFMDIEYRVAPIFLVSMLTILLSTLMFVLLLGTWSLQLPKGALGPNTLDVRTDWQLGEKRPFLFALTAIYLVPAFFEQAITYLFWAYGTMQGVYVASIASVCLNLFSATLGLVLLTVVYRQQLDRAGMTFDRKDANVV